MTSLPQKIMILGSGELGKEVTIAAQRLGCNVIACDRYRDAPAMQVADSYEVFDMSNSTELLNIINKNKPNIIIPEIEAIEVNTLIEIEKQGITVIPNANATAITMNRDKIRNLAAEELGLKTPKFSYASDENELLKASELYELPVIIKPIMSSSGKGQSFIDNKEELINGWNTAIKNARGKSARVIIEEFINFDQEITLLTIRQKDGSVLFCDPIGHEQSNGDYQCSWQPAEIKPKQLETAKEMAKKVTEKLGGTGLFGVEFFICGEEVIFSELSPRPHDTGLVTIISQNLNEFELHLRAVLGFPIPRITRSKAAASRVILAKDVIDNIVYEGVDEALQDDDTKVLIFGKPKSRKGRRMGVTLAIDENIIKARKKADKSASLIKVKRKDNNL